MQLFNVTIEISLRTHKIRKLRQFCTNNLAKYTQNRTSCEMKINVKMYSFKIALV